MCRTMLFYKVWCVLKGMVASIVFYKAGWVPAFQLLMLYMV